MTMEKEEIMDKVIEILSKHEEHTSEGGIYWEYEWVGGKAIPDGMGGYEQIGGEKVSAEEAFYKEMADFISSELDKAREEERREILKRFRIYKKEYIEHIWKSGIPDDLIEDTLENVEEMLKELSKLKDNK